MKCNLKKFLKKNRRIIKYNKDNGGNGGNGDNGDSKETLKKKIQILKEEDDEEKPEKIKIYEYKNYKILQEDDSLVTREEELILKSGKFELIASSEKNFKKGQKCQKSQKMQKCKICKKNADLLFKPKNKILCFKHSLDIIFKDIEYLEEEELEKKKYLEIFNENLKENKNKIEDFNYIIKNNILENQKTYNKNLKKVNFLFKKIFSETQNLYSSILNSLKSSIKSNLSTFEELKKSLESERKELNLIEKDIKDNFSLIILNMEMPPFHDIMNLYEEKSQKIMLKVKKKREKILKLKNKNFEFNNGKKKSDLEKIIKDNMSSLSDYLLEKREIDFSNISPSILENLGKIEEKEKEIEEKKQEGDKLVQESEKVIEELERVIKRIHRSEKKNPQSIQSQSSQKKNCSYGKIEKNKNKDFFGFYSRNVENSGKILFGKKLSLNVINRNKSYNTRENSYRSRGNLCLSPLYTQKRTKNNQTLGILNGTDLKHKDRLQNDNKINNLARLLKEAKIKKNEKNEKNGKNGKNGENEKNEKNGENDFFQKKIMKKESDYFIRKSKKNSRCFESRKEEFVGDRVKISSVKTERYSRDSLRRVKEKSPLLAKREKSEIFGRKGSDWSSLRGERRFFEMMKENAPLNSPGGEEREKESVLDCEGR